MNIVFLGIGTNLGDRESNLRSALKMIEKEVGIITGSSAVYETEPWGFESENHFLNMVVKVDTIFKPAGLLKRIMMAETLLGRLRQGAKYSSRVIDIDILFFNDLVIDRPGLKIPHPGIPDRKFILVPLCDLAPGFMHPLLKKPLRQLLDECKDKGEVGMFREKGYYDSPD